MITMRLIQTAGGFYKLEIEDPPSILVRNLDGSKIDYTIRWNVEYAAGKAVVNRLNDHYLEEGKKLLANNLINYISSEIMAARRSLDINPMCDDLIQVSTVLSEDWYEFNTPEMEGNPNNAIVALKINGIGACYETMDDAIFAIDDYVSSWVLDEED